MLAGRPWGAEAQTGFPNTAIYPPFFYLPAAGAASVLRNLGVDLPHALVLMRMATGLCAVAIAGTAIAVAGPAAIWLFAVLLLPMSLALTASLSQDSLMLACTALAVALYLRLRNAPARGRVEYVAFCVILSVIGMARPPYAAFSLLILALPLRRATRAFACAGVLLSVLAWGLVNIRNVVLPRWQEGPAIPLEQLRGLAFHPGRLPALLAETWRVQNELTSRSFIGLLGWLDVPLPNIYHHMAWLGLALAAVAGWSASSWRLPERAAWLAGCAMLAAVAGVALFQYMTWASVGAPFIPNLQGRYFLPPALLLGALLSFRKSIVKPIPAWLGLPVLLFPIPSIAMTIHAIIIRYYI
jgi:uncharacterized membrane protein